MMQPLNCVPPRAVPGYFVPRQWKSTKWIAVFYLRKKNPPLSCDVRRFTASWRAAEVKSVPLSVIVYSEILFMDDERPSLSSYSRRVLAQYWLLKEKFLGSESGCAAAAAPR